MERDYSNISPSARMLLMMKGSTPIPYARQAAELIMKPEKYEPDLGNKDSKFWMRMMHFEERYNTIDRLLEKLDIRNILELSSGFSFRGLEMTGKLENLHYIDTDLPDIITTKKKMLKELNGTAKENSKLELLPMNALDGKEFHRIVQRFDAGPIAIINEGLLMYLGENEKKRLCKTIHDILKERGGYWITADVYVKNEMAKFAQSADDEFSRLIAEEQVEEKKFDDFNKAKEFFTEAGFEIDKTAGPNYFSLRSLRYLLKILSMEMLIHSPTPPRIHETWRLKVV